MTLQELKDNRTEVLSVIPEYAKQYGVMADLKIIMEVMAIKVEVTRQTEIELFVSEVLYEMRPLKDTVMQRLSNKEYLNA